MYSRHHCLIHLFMACILWVVAVASRLASLAAHAQSVPKLPTRQPAATTILHGHVADPTGALIPGATSYGCKRRRRDGEDRDGGRRRHLPMCGGSRPAATSSSAASPGFAPFNRSRSSWPPVKSNASISHGGRSGATERCCHRRVRRQSTWRQAGMQRIVIKGKDLDALSDDPDELSNELPALQGRRPGPMADKSISMALAEGSFRLSRPSARFASIRIHFRPSSTGLATGALRS